MESIELEKLLSIARHDLLSPARKIHSFGGLLKKNTGPALDESGTMYLDRMMVSANAMTDRLNDFMNYLQITLADTFETERIDLNLLADLLEVDFTARNPGLHLTIDRTDLGTIDANMQLTETMMREILSNSIKFRKPEEGVVVRIKREWRNGCDSLCISDNGIGFSSEYSDKAIQPFHQLNPKGEFQGTGMGLALCSKIAERHDWSLKIQSEVNKGTTVVVQLIMKP